jgi:hypothetical protein
MMNARPHNYKYSTFAHQSKYRTPTTAARIALRSHALKQPHPFVYSHTLYPRSLDAFGPFDSADRLITGTTPDSSGRTGSRTSWGLHIGGAQRCMADRWVGEWVGGEWAKRWLSILLGACSCESHVGYMWVSWGSHVGR